MNRKSAFYKGTSLFLSAALIVNILAPSISYATGPTQPEVQSFEPASTENMVDPFTGNFTYNIPLFELPGPNGGYPFNLAYNSGITMEQEASWVGLGWNISPGSITRQVRGLPDEFSGDIISTKQDMKPMLNYGINTGGDLEIAGASPLSLGTSIYYNNYRGLGIGLNAAYNPPVPGVNSVGLDFDSQNGIGGSISLGDEKGSMDLGFNSESGPSLGMSLSRQNRWDKSRSKSASSSLISTPLYSYSPTIGTEYTSVPLSLMFKTGIGIGIFADMYFGGFFNISSITNKETQNKAFGYYNLHDSDRDSKSLMDFNREKESIINEKSPNLPIPVTTPDIYSISGQSINGMFRAWRHFFGSVYDPEAKSITRGGSLGVDIPTQLGIKATYTHGTSRSGEWKEENELSGQFEYIQNTDTLVSKPNYEPAYFKMYGEKNATPHLIEDIYGEERPVASKLERVNKSGVYRNKAQFYNDLNNSFGPPAPNELQKGFYGVRNVKTSSIQPFLNELIMSGNSELLGEYQINYYEINYSANNLTTLDRTNSIYKPHHFAGMTVLNESGTRYVYGLPAMNLSQVECTFSTNEDATDCRSNIDITTSGNEIEYKFEGTDKYLKKTETPEYAHSYLLTSVLGHDYVDVNGNGPDNDDIGYWVKFTYTKKSDNYEWRTPYKGAFYNTGIKSKKSDNTGSYSYGTKEIWYLATAETKSHIAIFDLKPRSDSKEANGEFATLNSSTGSESYFALDKIRLYTKIEYQKELFTQDGTPIQTIQFNHDYSLCPGVENSTSGKLTLTSVETFYQNNERGRQDPYVFTYGETTDNPGYSKSDYDRWGNYKNGTTDLCVNTELPYVQQFNDNNLQTLQEKSVFKNSIIDKNMSAWNLSEISTPTGSTIKVTYESDDYGYVQHRKATQMFKINNLAFSNPQQVYDSDYRPGDSRITFKLENPIPVSVSDAKSLFYEEYLKDLEKNGTIQIYYKLYANLRDNVWDYISGYTGLTPSQYGVVSGSVSIVDGVNCYTKGFIDVEPFYDSKSNEYYHPFAVNIWQTMLTDHPELLTSGGDFEADPGSSDFDKAVKAKSIINFIPQLKKMFKGYRKHCKSENWGNAIDLTRSVLKLCSPDGIKYGGGERVKKIEVFDGFAVNGVESSYGQIYDYKTIDENGRTISSGVASYEPTWGGDENALRHAKFYTEKQAYKSGHNRIIEFPINESYYPAASVGYTKVTVRSLATDKVLKGLLPVETASTGEVVYEFYTSKEFPTITRETDITKKPYHLNIPILFIGNISNSKLTASQGYSAEVNDMHGKQKSIGYYGIEEGKILDVPVSSVEYYYNSEKLNYDNKTVSRITGMAPSDPSIPSTNFGSMGDYMGVHYEFFTDSRENSNYQLQVGLDLNIILPFIPIPCPWPSYVENSSMVRTNVQNKIIHHTGVLMETRASDGLSHNISTNLKFDKYTGNPYLIKSQNNFSDPVYHYKASPSVAEYNGNGSTGAAYLNFGYKGTTSILGNLVPSSLHSIISNDLYPEVNNNLSKLYASSHTYATSSNGFHFSNNNIAGGSGAEVILINLSTGNKYNITIVPITTNRRYQAIYSDVPLPQGDYKYFVVRSGRNVLNLIPAEVSSLTKPEIHNFLIAHCVNSESVNIDGTNVPFGYLEDVLNVKYQEYSAFWPNELQSMNPYKSGEFGTIRLKNDWNYVTPRKKNTNIHLKEDGVFTNDNGLDRFYPYKNSYTQVTHGSNIPLDTDDGYNKHWIKNSEIIQYDNYGHPVESMNALGVYASADYGYNGMLMQWEASNSKKSESFFYGAEDNTSLIYDLSNNVINPHNSGGHTGLKSLEIAQLNVTLRTTVIPMEGNKYHFSAWIKGLNENTFDYKSTVDVDTRGVELLFYNEDFTTLSGTSTFLKPTGKIIEGWQKVEGTILIEGNGESPVEAIALRINPGTNNSVVQPILMDDIRLFPADGQLKSYVYDESTYRLRAELDENNFASFYYYDEEGNLFLVKKETEVGVFTIQESRFNK